MRPLGVGFNLLHPTQQTMALTAVAAILQAKNHFMVLGLEQQEHEVKTVRVAFRALALQVHPDKNPAEHRDKAQQAFVVLSNAFEVLSGACLALRMSVTDLADANNQAAYLRDLGRKQGAEADDYQAQSRKRKRPAGAAPQKWWENRSWEELDAEIKRQEEQFGCQTRRVSGE